MLSTHLCTNTKSFEEEMNDIFGEDDSADLLGQNDWSPNDESVDYFSEYAGNNIPELNQTVQAEPDCGNVSVQQVEEPIVDTPKEEAPVREMIKLPSLSLLRIESEATQKSTPVKNPSRANFFKDTSSPISPKMELNVEDNSLSKQNPTCRKNQQWRNIMGSEERSKNGRRILALRADVMNKNIFRAIRRECKSMFENFLLENGFTNSRSKRIFRANLRRFSDYLVEGSNDENANGSEFDDQDFKVYVGIFLNICLMKKLFPEAHNKEKCVEFNDLLYSYSHKKFYDFVSKPEVSKLIKAIFSKKGLRNFISSHHTLSANKETYTSHIQRLISNI